MLQFAAAEDGRRESMLKQEGTSCGAPCNHIRSATVGGVQGAAGGPEKLPGIRLEEHESHVNPTLAAGKKWPTVFTARPLDQR